MDSPHSDLHAASAARPGRFQRSVLWLTLVAMVAQPVGVSAQVVAAAAGSHRPQIDSAANGVPLIQITTPSAAGVSHNQYQQFDVSARGVVLNNSRTIVQTQLAGYTAGNPNLATAARIIVNEVTSTLPSSLRGYTEVGGARAEVIIANPNGITCDGCGFINASRGVLTTGTPVFGAGGSLDAFRVVGGQIAIDGAGLDAGNLEQIDLIARAVTVNAGLWGQALNVVTGASQVAYADLSSQAIAGDGAAPAVSIDVAQLGGMYANKIRLVGSEAGVGVVSAGNLVANAGEIVISAAGQLRNTGSMASNNIRIDAGGVDNGGKFYAQGDVSVHTGGAIDNSGVIAVHGNTVLNAGGTTGPTAAGQLRNSGSITSRNIRIDAGGLDNGGKLYAQGDVSVHTGGTIDNGGVIAAQGNTILNAGGATGQIRSRSGSVLGAGILGDGSAGATGALTLNATQTVSAEGQNISGGDLAIRAQSIWLNGSQTSGSNLRLLSGSDLDTRGATLAAADTLAIQATGSWRNDDGRLSARLIEAAVFSLANVRGEIVQTGTNDLQLALPGMLDNTQGLIAGNGSLRLGAGQLFNRAGTLHAQGSAAVPANLTLAIAGQIDNSALNGTGGRISADGKVQIDAGELDNTQSSITAGQTLHIRSARALGNSAGLLASNRDLRIEAAQIDNRQGTMGSVTGAGDLLARGGMILNASGRIEAASTLALTSSGLVNSDGVISAANLNIDSAAQAIDNRRGTLSANGTDGQGTLVVSSGALNNDAGLIQANTALSIDTHGAGLNNANTRGKGGIVSQGSALLTAGDIDNTAGAIGSKGELEVNGQIITNTQGLLSSESQLTLSAAAVDNRAGQLQTNGATTLSLANGAIDNRGGLIHSGDTLSVSAGTVNNADTSGQDQGLEGQSLRITAQRIDNQRGALRADDDLLLTSSGTIDNSQGSMSSRTTLTIRDGKTAGGSTLAVVNSGGTLLAGQRLSIDGARLGGDGTLLSSGDLNIKLVGDYTHTGRLQADRSATLETSGALNNRATLLAGTALSLKAASLDNQAAGEIRATSVKLSASAMNNRGLIDGLDTVLEAGTLDNLGTGRIFGDHLAISAATLNNAPENARAPVIAARRRLDIGVGNLNNHDDALIYSAGDLAIGGGLDANKQAVGQAASVTNSSATIEADGKLVFSAAQVINRRTQFAVTQTSGTPYAVYETLDYRPAGPWALFKAALATPSNTVVNVDSGAGRILSGGDMLFNGAVTNDKSDILAGGSIVLDRARYVGTSQQGQSFRGESGITIYCISCANGKNFSGSESEQNLWDLAELSRVITLPVLEKWAATGYDEKDLFSTPYTGKDPKTGKDTYGPPVRLLDWRLQGINTPYSSSGTVLGNYDLAPARLTANQAIVGTATQLSNLNLGGGVGQTATGTTAGSVSTGSRRTVSPITQVAALAAVGTVIRSGGINTTLPNNSLYTLHPGTGGGYLVETDPRFTNYRTWVSSDYMLNALGFDPAKTEKRLGDGFYEQKLVNEQVAALTGRRFLDGYSDGETQFRALLDQGTAYAKAHQLTPGVALTAEQMASLTSDIVWLVEQEVTLPDGSRSKALVPQLYARVSEGESANGGALIAADRIELTVSGDLTNAGTLAARSALALAADNLTNLGGRIKADQVSLSAATDLSNLGGRIDAGSRLDLSAGRDLKLVSDTVEHSEQSGSIYQQRSTALDHVASISVSQPGGTLVASAGRDLNLVAARVDSAGSARLEAGNNINVGTLATGDLRNIDLDADNYSHSQSRGEAGSRLTAQGDLTLAAGANITARAANVQAGGALHVFAGRDINLTTGLDTLSVDSAQKDTSGGLFSRKTTVTRDTFEQTTALASTFSGNSVALRAGQDIAIKGSNVSATGDLSLAAARDLIVETAQNTANESHFRSETQSGFSASFSGGISYGSSAQAQNAGQTTTQAVGSVLSAGTIETLSGRDTRLTGSTLVADSDVAMIAGRDLSISSAQDTRQSESGSSSRTSGFVGSFWQPAVGAVKQSQTNQGSSITQIGSQVASLAGEVKLRAGERYTQTASQVLAPEGDIDIRAKTLLINAADNSESATQSNPYSKTAIGGTISVPLLDAVKSVASVGKAAAQTSDSRMQALAAVTAGLQAKAAYDSAQALSSGSVGGIKISVSLGTSKSESQSTLAGTTAVGSTIGAGGNVSLKASGAGQDSDITAVGARVSAGNDISLKADGDILLQAGQNSYTQSSSNSNSGASVGVGFSFGGTQNGFTLELAANKGRGKADGADIAWSNTTLDAGNVLSLESGGDTTLKGAVARGEQVAATVGGKLAIESLQDTSVYDSRQSSAGFSLSLCIPPFCYGASSGSVSAGKSQIASNYASVGEQSGILAGDKGFQVKVKGDTDLKGAVIASTEKAVLDGKNSFSTGGTLTMSDLRNTAEYDAAGYAVTLSGSTKLGDQTSEAAQKTMSAADKAAAGSKESGLPNSQLAGAGVGQDSGSAGSTSRSGISGIAGDTAVRSGDAQSGIKKIFDADKVQKEIDAQVQITQAFGQQASKAVGDYVQEKRAALQQQLKDAPEQEKSAVQAKISELNTQERVMNVLIGAVSGMGASALTKEGLSAAADQMRQYMIEDSGKFVGAVDSEGKVLSNLLVDKSEGVRGDETGLAGTRGDLDLLCGADNSRCAIQSNPDGTPVLVDGKTVLATTTKGFVQFTAKDENDNPITFADFMKTDEGKKMAGPTGGVQGFKGTLFGVPYEAGSWQDKLLEAFSGTHDFIGGKMSGLYDEQGNIKREMTEAEINAYAAWSAVALVPSAPFAVAELLSPEVWSAISILLKAGR